MAQSGSSQKAKFIDPPNRLREKVGYGGIDPQRLEKAEEYVANYRHEDFLPYARQRMQMLQDLINKIESGKIPYDESMEQLTQPIMELKASGAMFGYQLISEIASIVLDFLENIDEMNEDSMAIIRAHQNTLSVIINNGLTGSGGKEGRALAEELFGACKRYYKRYNVKK